MAKWIHQVKGNPDGDAWEISVVRTDNEHGRKSWGWFDENKLLVSHNGGPCDWPLAPGLGTVMVKIAERLADRLNTLGLDAIKGGTFAGMEESDSPEFKTRRAFCITHWKWSCPCLPERRD